MTAAGGVPPDQHDLLLRAYAAYNTQDLEALLASVSDDVDWPGDDDGVRMHGKHQARLYWTDQWSRVHTHDEPQTFSRLNDGRTAVQGSQVVRTLDGSVISQGRFCHLHRIDTGHITRMDKAVPEDLEELANAPTAR